MIAVILKRVKEIFLGSIICSALFNYFMVNSDMSETSNTARILQFCIFIVFMIYNGYMMRHLYFSVNDSFDYYLFNTVSIIITIVAVIVFRMMLSQNIYLWFFSFVHIFDFMFEEIENIFGIILFCFSLFVSCFLSEKYYDGKVR